jgi:hypothetical protein
VIEAHNDEGRDIMTGPGAMYRACVDSGPRRLCRHRGRGCAKEDICSRSADDTCALATYFDFLDGFDPGKCQWEPGGKECGCSTAGLDNLVPSCSGTYRECVGYGNEGNFGGPPQDGAVPEAQDFPQVRRLLAEAAEELEGDTTTSHRHNPTIHILNGVRSEAVRPVQAYEVDGELYKSRSEAQRIAAEKTFVRWYEEGADNALYGRYEGSKIDGDKMLEWIKEHAPTLDKLLKTMV